MVSSNKQDHPPVVLVAGGLDPTGSAGLLADVRVLGSIGCHPCGVVTCETVQTSHGLTGIVPTDPEILREQLTALLGDMKFNAVKIGALASVKTIEVIGWMLGEIPDVPVVLDPVFAPSEGPPFLDMDGMRAMSEHLLEQVLIATPNVDELGMPAGLEVDQDNDEMILGCASGWFAAGVETLLVTGLVRDGNKVDRLIRMVPDASFSVEDFPHPIHDVGTIHGSGCILSSSIAGYIGAGEKLADAVRMGSEFTSGLIKQARAIGGGAAFWIDRMKIL